MGNSATIEFQLIFQKCKPALSDVRYSKFVLPKNIRIKYYDNFYDFFLMSRFEQENICHFSFSHIYTNLHSLYPLFQPKASKHEAGLREALVPRSLAT